MDEADDSAFEDPPEDEAGDPGPGNVVDEILSAMKGQRFESLEEAQAFTDNWLRKRNTEALPEFQGFSPEQMHRLLYWRFEKAHDVVVLNGDLTGDDFAESPVVKEAVYLLNRISELEPLRATAKGNLPLALAREIHEAFPDPSGRRYPIRSEGQDSKLSGLRRLMEMCGWVKSRKQLFSLTAKGRKVVKKGFGSGDFHLLFETYLTKFNWAYRDLYPPLRIIQSAVVFSCYLLHRRAGEETPSENLAEEFLQAFPMATAEVRDFHLVPAEDQVKRAFELRFVERFCEYFGLVAARREKKKMWDVECFVRTTSLFERLFQWKMP